MNLISKIQFFLFFLFLLSCIVSCDKNKYEQVPNVPVNISVNLYPNLEFMGIGETVMILPGNSNNAVIRFNGADRADIQLTSKVYGYGIILYRYAREIFVAYDRTCTFKPETNYCGLEFDNSGILPTCPCCSSKFIVSYAGEATGYPTSDSQAALALKQYKTTVSNGWLTITNF